MFERKELNVIWRFRDKDPKITIGAAEAVNLLMLLVSDDRGGVCVGRVTSQRRYGRWLRGALTRLLDASALNSHNTRFREKEGGIKNQEERKAKPVICTVLNQFMLSAGCQAVRGNGFSDGGRI